YFHVVHIYLHSFPTRRSSDLLYVLNIGVTFLSVSFLTASFLLETTSWFMTIIIVFVLGGLSFTKTVISTIVSSSLKQQEAGAGMSLLNFTSFLSEGTGI